MELNQNSQFLRATKKILWVINDCITNPYLREYAISGICCEKDIRGRKKREWTQNSCSWESKKFNSGFSISLEPDLTNVQKIIMQNQENYNKVTTKEIEFIDENTILLTEVEEELRLCRLNHYHKMTVFKNGKVSYQFIRESLTDLELSDENFVSYKEIIVCDNDISYQKNSTILDKTTITYSKGEIPFENWEQYCFSKNDHMTNLTSIAPTEYLAAQRQFAGKNRKLSK